MRSATAITPNALKEHTPCWTEHFSGGYRLVLRWRLVLFLARLHSVQCW